MTTTNRALFMAVWKRRDLESALRAVGVDPNGTHIKRLRLAKPSAEAVAIVNAVAAEHGIAPEAVLATSRVTPLLAARTEAMRRMQALRWSTSRIAREMGRSRSAVMCALESGERRAARKAAVHARYLARRAA